MTVHDSGQTNDRQGERACLVTHDVSASGQFDRRTQVC